MKACRKLAHAAIVLACVGMIVPNGAMAAGPAKAGVADVALATDGRLVGQVVSAEGRAIDGAVVTVRRSGHELVQAVTDKSGQFAVSGLDAGVYEVAVGQQVAAQRGAQLASAESVGGGKCKIVLLVPGANGERPKREEIIVNG